MKTALCLALTALLAVSGCSADDSADSPCDGLPPSPGGSPLPRPPSFRVAVPASLPISAIQQLACEGSSANQVAQSVTAEVFDPDNQPVPSEVMLDRSGLSATVQFTPRTTGRHHVLVAFAPVGSVQQLGIYVVGDWTGASTATTLPLPRCTQLDRTTRGTWVCDGVALREPGGRLVRYSTSSTAPDVAIAGNVVWMVGEGRVRRYVDTGTELELTGSLLVNTSVRTIQSRLATEDELLVLDDANLHRFTFTDAGVLAAAGATSWLQGANVPFGVDSVSAVLVRTSERQVRVVKMGPASASLACPFELGPDGKFVATDEPCLPLPGTPVGLEDGILWTRVGSPNQAPFAQTLHRWVASDGTLEEEGTLAVDSPVEEVSSPLRPGFVVPDIHLGFHPGAFSVLPVVSPESKEGPLGLEVLPINAAIPRELRGASPRFYWEGDNRQTTGTTVVYERLPR
ncbi:hypothetical protein [Pyxidicoccus xibeiensis]|uniref:hypothetical protein n=1 Tax=Pyxidicoccus xibeiensis TaxID=2906759 RepID=UPI0020A784DC|nr:hypothetical protein [Pyxidicoccus xibeiensis]MCP3136514.1 hypothetical protein [Pyxidicoccus xibeiensis]